MAGMHDLDSASLGAVLKTALDAVVGHCQPNLYLPLTWS